MLAAIGVRSMEALLVDIPSALRIKALDLPAGLSEHETMAQISSLAAGNRVFPDRLTFRGGGGYRRFIPAAGAAGPAKPAVFTADTPLHPGANPRNLPALFQLPTLLAGRDALGGADASRARQRP